MSWRCPVITRMGMCPITSIECPAHDPKCPHLPDEHRPPKAEQHTTDHVEVVVADGSEAIFCPKCSGGLFGLRKTRLSDRMLASARLDVICMGCGHRESLYRIGDSE